VATETITLKLIAQDLMSGNVSKAIGNIDKLAKQGGLMGSVMQGVGQSFGQMLNPVALVANGIGMVTDALGDATTAFREDQVSQAQLRTALEANITAWDGNTDAIEEVLAARMKLGFSDDDQRASLALLIAQTKDVSAALDIQATAMDFARLKSISLEDASGTLAKAYLGNVTALNKMGFKLAAGTKGTAALAEVQKRAGGQAEAYSKTSAGAAARLDASVGELQESLGSFLNGPAVGFTEFLNELVVSLQGPTGEMKIAIDYINRYGVAVQGATAPAAKLIDEQRAKLAAYAADLTQYLSDNKQYMEQIGSGKSIEWIERIPATLALASGASASSLQVLAERVRLQVGESEAAYRWFLMQVQDLIGQQIEVTGRSTNATEAWASGFVAAAGDVGGAAKRITLSVKEASDEFWNLTSGIVAAVKTGIPDVKSVMKDLRWAIEHPMKLASTRAEIEGALTSKRLARGMRSNNPLVRQAAIDARNTLLTQWNGLPQKAMELGRLTIAELVRGLNEGEQYALGLYGSTGTASGDRKIRNRTKPPKKAGGGPVFAGQMYEVNEGGRREFFEPAVNGTILSANQTAAMGNGGGGTTVHVHFHGVVAAPTEAEAARIASVIGPGLTQWQRRQGVVR
jgi:hypothetical protein